jgi:transcriptional regulator with XRE-family HTH domain
MNGRALLAWNLRRLRGERGISQERLAADAGVDRAYVSEIERELGNATLDMLDKLAALLNVPIHELFREPQAGAKPPLPLPGGRPVTSKRPAKRSR